jgi:hypothetical protein
MKFIAMICGLLLLSLAGCAGEEPPTAVSAGATSIGEIHNELLGEIYSRTKTGEDAAVFEAARAVALRHGVTPFTGEEVERYRRRGATLARLTPRQIMATALTPDEMAWWERFQADATPSKVRETFEKHCAAYGSPQRGSTLADAMDIYVHSAEFWYPRFFAAGKNANPQSWLEFLVCVAVDALVGGAASSTLTPMGGAIAGGLASEGAHSIMSN